MLCPPYCPINTHALSRIITSGGMMRTVTVSERIAPSTHPESSESILEVVLIHVFFGNINPSLPSNNFTVQGNLLVTGYAQVVAVCNGLTG